MGTVDLWLGPAGAGKTGKILSVLRDELQRDWRSVRYLVPTVSHKQSIEQLFLERFDRHGLFGDPITTFFNFAEEVARRANVRGHKLSELQKHLFLKQLARESELEYFATARQYPGFVQVLEEAIDELKVHMILPQALLDAARVAATRGATAFAQKVSELGTLYAQYQQRVYREDLYDNEGIMWIAAEHLTALPELYADLHCLILDGFARLTPVQVHFLRALAPQVERIIVLFDYEEGRGRTTYTPVQVSLDQLQGLYDDGLLLRRQRFASRPSHSTLECLRAQIFREQPAPCNTDHSLGLFIGATPAHEAELIARHTRALLREGALPDGTPITADDIAILARDAGQVHERLLRTFQRFGLAIRRNPTPIAHTSLGRALSATFRLVRERWKREDVLTLLKSGFLSIDRAVAFHIDLIARTHYLRESRATWLERWPDEETRDVLHQALAPLAAFDEAYHQLGHDPAALMEALTALLSAFRANALPPEPPFPDADPAGAQRYMDSAAAFTQVERLLGDLQNVAPLLGGFRREETLDAFLTALQRESMPVSAADREGIPVISVHTPGGEKFKVVFLCGLREGAFPLHRRESAFLMDHEREETLRELQIMLDPRKHLEEDEQYWFLHALSSATHRLILSYAQHDSSGSPLERSSFLDEVERIVPDLRAEAVETQFRDVVPPLRAAENAEEFLAGLAFGLRTAREKAAWEELAAAYTACGQSLDFRRRLTEMFRLSAEPLPALAAPEVLAAISNRARPFSASELQAYLDCPFLWFGSYALRVEPVSEEFSPLDRGQIIHAVLEDLYRGNQQYPGEPVHLERFTHAELWPQVEANLAARLEREPRFQNRAAFLRDIEWNALRGMLSRFLSAEITRARTRRTHPAYFERLFGANHTPALLLDGGTVALRGKIDRIDIADDDPHQAVVVDYKASTRMSLRDLETGKVLQAPIYALALAQTFKLQTLGAEFVSIAKGETKGIYRQGIKEMYPTQTTGIKEVDEDRWQALLADCTQRLTDAVHAMRTGHIALQPTTPRCPDTCPYLVLCRGNRFQLARTVRAAGKVEEAEEVAAT
ncbi:MAG: PD-(D/E)XK nuclease family protein [Armatimonadota bacterium]